jgi:hypothetical protein
MTKRDWTLVAIAVLLLIWFGKRRSIALGFGISSNGNGAGAGSGSGAGSGCGCVSGCGYSTTRGNPIPLTALGGPGDYAQAGLSGTNQPSSFTESLDYLHFGSTQHISGSFGDYSQNEGGEEALVWPS